MELREYQVEAISKLRDEMKNHKHVILQAACGAGKTIISAEIARLSIKKGKKVLFLVNRRDLIRQTVEKYEAFGLNPGVIMAGEESILGRPIQCASLQTLVRRLKKGDEFFHDADLVIYDECQSSNAPTYKEILGLYADRYVLGLSATPMGAGGTGLGGYYEKIIKCIPMQELISNGYLVPAVHYAPSKPDLKGCKITANDWNSKDLGKRTDKPKLIGDILENWLKIASDRKTIIFAVNVKHSKHIRDKFAKKGINIAHIDADTKDEDRERIYDDFQHGDLQIITNVGVACEGSDLPICACICVARPTRILARWIQMAGRGARIYPGKENYLLLDFAGCIEAHGFVDDEIAWNLNAKAPAAKKAVVRKRDKKIMTCNMCKHAFVGNKCPECGTKIKDYGKKIEALEADLEVAKRDKPKIKPATTAEKKQWYAMLEYERKIRGYQPGWTAHKYKTKFGCWPKNMKSLPPQEPTLEFKNWIIYQNIKYHKRRVK